MNYQQSCSSPVANSSPCPSNSSNRSFSSCGSNGENNGFVGNSSPANNVRPLSVNLKDHCILCLESEEPSILQEILTTNPKSILNFQPLVYYLTAIDPTDSGREQKARLLESRKYFPVIGNLPPMCTHCYEVLGEMYRLHLELVDIQVKIQRQIALARRIVKYTVKETRASGRLASVRSKFLNELGTGMRCLLTREEMDGLRYFLENFHGLIIEAENKFIFPCPPPPPDPNLRSPQPPPPLPTALMTLSYPVHFTLTSSTISPNDGIQNFVLLHQEAHKNYNPSQFPSTVIPSVDAASSLDDVRTSSSPSSSVQMPLDDSNKSRNSEMIVVSGIDVNLKYEVEDEEVEDGEEDEQDLNRMVFIKEDLNEEAAENNYQEIQQNDDSEDQKLIIEPVNDTYAQQQPEINKNSANNHLESAALPTFPSSPHLWQVQTQSCDVCNKTYHIANLPNHMKDHLGRRRVWTCDICHQVYLSRSKLILHFEEFNTGSWCREHSQWYRNLTHFCTTCSTQLPTEAFLHHHVFFCHESDPSLESSYLCKMCCRKFRTEQALDFHFITHMHRCQRRRCWKFLQPLAPPLNNNGLAAAVVSSRSCGGGYGATITSSSNATVSAAAAAAIPNTGAAFSASDEPDDYSCEICGKKCVGSTSLLRHVKEVHKLGKRKQGEMSMEEQESVDNNRKTRNE